MIKMDAMLFKNA